MHDGREMSEPNPQPGFRSGTSRVAIGAAERFPIVLVEATGVTGVLVAERRCPDKTLERVVYFRSLMGQPYARFFEKVELVRIGDYYLARAIPDNAVFYEPSRIPYAVENITKEQYDDFVDNMTAYDCSRIERFVASAFSKSEGFSLDASGALNAPEDYSNGMLEFLATVRFVEPNEPTGSQV